jgi:hypothetical protein
MRFQKLDFEPRTARWMSMPGANDGCETRLPAKIISSNLISRRIADHTERPAGCQSGDIRCSQKVEMKPRRIPGQVRRGAIRC